MSSSLRDFGTVELLGEGATAEVFRGRHDGRPAALKRARTPDDDALLTDEAAVLRELEGPWFPRVLAESRDASGRVVLVTSLAEGAPLDPRALAKDERPALARRVLVELSKAFATLSVAGIAHGDVKPANVIVSPTRVTLVDFGLAARGHDGARGFSPRYRAPELGPGVDPGPADRFALGVLVAEILSREVATSDDPARTFLELRSKRDPLGSVVRALLGPAATRPSPLDALSALDEAPDTESLVAAAWRRAGGERSACLALLAGPFGASLADAIPGDDMAFLSALRGLGARRPDPRAWTMALVGADEALTPDEPVALALALSSPRPSRADVERGLASDHPKVLLAALDALVRQGALGEALARNPLATPTERAHAADVARRLGQVALAKQHAELAKDDPLSRAVLARLAVDAGQPDVALRRATGRSPAEREVRALAQLAKGAPRAARDEVAAALATGVSETQRARLAGVLGYVAHAEGRTRAAEDAFVDASESARRAGSAVEEATYLTGVAASAADGGRIARGLDASERAVALWLALGRGRDAARALLAKAAALRSVGANELAIAAALRARREARAAGDATAHAYASLVLVDAGRPEALDDALRIPTDEEDVRFRVASRRLRLGRATDDEIAAGDVTAADDRRAIAARLDWWIERAARPGAAREVDVLRELAALLPREAPLDVRGRGAAAAVALAQRAGRGDDVRALVGLLRELAEALLAGTPRELREPLFSVPWVSRALALDAGQSTERGKLGDVERLVRALSDRTSLRRLAEQALDAMVLWTGVERGVLLVPAPSGRLVPRAARNLAREDLVGPQLELSRTLASRALAERRPVVAVDAAGELSDTSRSVHLLKLKSVLAVPLLAKGRTLGVVYLDDRARRGAFGPDELAWVGLAADVAALALADAFDRVALRRAARRAERAQARLARVVATQGEALAYAEAELRKGQHPDIVGDSPSLTRAVALAERVAKRDVPVLVIGESGSGKELFARAIHGASARARARFVAENCAGIPESLLESTLFGHVRGAFTGAATPSPGLFATADEGTLFLDEVGEMPLVMQAKLLRVLQDGEVRAVGASTSRKVDVRVIAATHRDLRAMVRAGTFREDLFYRLDVVELLVPPLRERPGDVPLLVAHFLHKHGRGERVLVTRAAMARLQSATWPGNVRQLENEVRRALALSDGRIDVEHLSPAIEPPPSSRDAGAFHQRLDRVARELVEDALRDSGGNVSQAAHALGLSRFGLQKMMKRLGLR